MGLNGGWSGSSRTASDGRNSRIPGAARGGWPNPQGGPRHRAVDSWVPDSHHGRSGPGMGLPPKPPVSAYQSWGDRDGRYDNRRGRSSQGRYGGRQDDGANSYVPNYQRSGDRRDRRDYYPRRRSRSPSYRQGERERDMDRGSYRR